MQIYSDVTENLKSLQFESSLEFDTQHLLGLRHRSHALFINACVHASFFVHAIHEFKIAKTMLKFQGKNKKAVKLMMEVDASLREVVYVGIIGLGRLGQSLANLFLDSSKINPTELHLSTRNSNVFNKFQSKDVNIHLDVAKLTAQCHVIFICVLPAHLEKLARQIRSVLRPQTILYVFTSGVKIARLSKIFANHRNIIVDQYVWSELPIQDENHLHVQWDLTANYRECFQRSDILKQTCPLTNENLQKSPQLQVLPKLFTVWIVGIANLCTSAKLSALSTLKILDSVFLAKDDSNQLTVDTFATDLSLLEAKKNQEINDQNDSVENTKNLVESNFNLDDLIRSELDNKTNEVLPNFNIEEIYSKTTYLDEKLEKNNRFQIDLLNVYLDSLQNFLKSHKFD